MKRQISPNFLKELKEGTLQLILEYVKNDDTLDMELRGNSVMIYYRGGKILEIKDISYDLVGLDNGYLIDKTIKKPSLKTFENYFPHAKHIIDYYVLSKRSQWEKEIQQRIVQENNYSNNSNDTDFFIIDIEYQDIDRWDIVALRWDSTSQARKLSKKHLPKITIFEVKQGFGSSISGDSGMLSHLNAFNTFLAKKEISAFKQDMIDVFQQKRELGLIRPINDNKHEITTVADDIDFVFLLTNYKPASDKLKDELKLSPDCKFIYANPMGYGLYARNIINKEKFIKRFLLT